MARFLTKTDQGIDIIDTQTPKIQNADDVLIRVKMAGLCRTDVFVATDQIKTQTPLTLGHEFSGIVTDIGNDVTNINIGDAVTVMPVMPCGTCNLCANGKADKCQDTTMLGLDCNGGFADYIIVPASATYVLPAGMPFQMAAYSEPVAAALSVVKSDIKPAEKGIIYGDNRFSALLKRILTAYGFDNITIYDETSAAAPAANQYDFAIETLANDQAMSVLCDTVLPGGKIIIKSRKHQPVGLNFSKAVQKELTFQAVNYGDFTEAIRLMAEGDIRVDDLFGEVYALEDYEDVFAKAQQSEGKKIFFDLEAA